MNKIEKLKKEINSPGFSKCPKHIQEKKIKQLDYLVLNNKKIDKNTFELISIENCLDDEDLVNFYFGDGETLVGTVRRIQTHIKTTIEHLKNIWNIDSDIEYILEFQKNFPDIVSYEINVEKYRAKGKWIYPYLFFNVEYD